MYRGIGKSLIYVAVVLLWFWVSGDSTSFEKWLVEPAGRPAGPERGTILMLMFLFLLIV